MEGFTFLYLQKLAMAELKGVVVQGGGAGRRGMPTHWSSTVTTPYLEI